jgi:hypothetical protein
MNLGKFVFAQVIEHLPLHAFHRCVLRYSGEHKVKRFSCLDQYLCMAFAQLTYRESLRDIEACLRVQSSKLYHLGFRSPVARNTLANANATRDWRIYCDFAQSLIGTARRLYADEAFGLDLKDTVYALDATTIDLCLSVFPWAPFRSTKAAVKLHTLLDLRGNIPSFIFISDGKLHEPGAIYVMDRRLRSARPLSRGRQLLRHPRQDQPQGRAPVLACGRPKHRPRLRPDRHAHRLLLAQGLPADAYTLPDQRVERLLTTTGDLGTVAETLAATKRGPATSILYSSTNCETLLVLRAKARKPRNVREWHGCLGQYHNTTIGMAGALIDGPIDTKWLQPDFDLPQHRYFLPGRVCPF